MYVFISTPRCGFQSRKVRSCISTRDCRHCTACYQEGYGCTVYLATCQAVCSSSVEPDSKYRPVMSLQTCCFMGRKGVWQFFFGHFWRRRRSVLLSHEQTLPLRSYARRASSYCTAEVTYGPTACLHAISVSDQFARERMKSGHRSRQHSF